MTRQISSQTSKPISAKCQKEYIRVGISTRAPGMRPLLPHPPPCSATHIHSRSPPGIALLHPSCLPGSFICSTAFPWYRRIRPFPWQILRPHPVRHVTLAAPDLMLHRRSTYRLGLPANAWFQNRRMEGRRGEKSFAPTIAATSAAHGCLPDDSHFLAGDEDFSAGPQDQIPCTR